LKENILPSKGRDFHKDLKPFAHCLYWDGILLLLIKILSRLKNKEEIPSFLLKLA
jgi:hypothetical protein